MNNDLLKRIDALLALRVENSATSTINNDCPLDPDVEKALRDCRAEIERKDIEYSEALQIAKYLWRKYYAEISPNWEALPDLRGVLSQIDNMVVGIESLSKPYVPMTDDEITEATQVMKHDLLHEPTLYCWRQVEAAVIKRLGLEIKHD